MLLAIVRAERHRSFHDNTSTSAESSLHERNQTCLASFVMHLHLVCSDLRLSSLASGVDPE